jgi:hypothetical protein
MELVTLMNWRKVNFLGRHVIPTKKIIYSIVVSLFPFPFFFLGSIFEVSNVVHDR